jgi:hypothetical protein
MDNQSQNPNPNSDDTGRKIKGDAAGFGIGGLIGGLLAKSIGIGIAAFGTAISGLWIVALIGGVVGWKLMSKQRRKKEAEKAAQQQLLRQQEFEKEQQRQKEILRQIDLKKECVNRKYSPWRFFWQTIGLLLFCWLYVSEIIKFEEQQQKYCTHIWYFYHSFTHFEKCQSSSFWFWCFSIIGLMLLGVLGWVLMKRFFVRGFLWNGFIWILVFLLSLVGQLVFLALLTVIFPGFEEQAINTTPNSAITKKYVNPRENLQNHRIQKEHFKRNTQNHSQLQKNQYVNKHVNQYQDQDGAKDYPNCVIKPVMTDDDYRACGATPP